MLGLQTKQAGDAVFNGSVSLFPPENYGSKNCFYGRTFSPPIQLPVSPLPPNEEGKRAPRRRGSHVFLLSSSSFLLSPVIIATIRIESESVPPPPSFGRSGRGKQRNVGSGGEEGEKSFSPAFARGKTEKTAARACMPLPSPFLFVFFPTTDGTSQRARGGGG